MTIQPSRLRAQVASLERRLEPGERIVAETFGQAGRVPWWEGPATYASYTWIAIGVVAMTALFIAGRPVNPATIWLLVAPAQVASLATTHHKPTYMVVTTRCIYLLRIPSRRHELERIIRIPLTYVRVGADRTGRFRRIIRLEGEYVPVRGL